MEQINNLFNSALLNNDEVNWIQVHEDNLALALNSSSPNLSLSCSDDSTINELVPTIKKKPKKGAWTKEEDGLLIQLMNENKNTISWSSFGRVIKTRTGKQCRERWHNHLDPNVNKAPFTDQENQIILDMYHKIGPKWATISKQLIGRPDNSIKNHFNTALNPHKQEARRKRKEKVEQSKKVRKIKKQEEVSTDYLDTTDYSQPSPALNLFDHFFNPDYSFITQSTSTVTIPTSTTTITSNDDEEFLENFSRAFLNDI